MQRQAFAQPEVVVTNVRLAGIGTQGGKIDIELAIFNPNNFRLDASSVRYRVMVDSIKLAEGIIEKRVTLLKRDSTKVHIPVNFGFREVLAVGARLAQTGSLPFDLEGELKVDTPFGSVSRAFAQRGSYDGLNISIYAGRR
jgi:LEA14-like dessication related protein